MDKQIKDKVINLLKNNNDKLLVLRFSEKSFSLGWELDILVKYKYRYLFIDEIKKQFPDFYVVTTEDENYKITVKVFLFNNWEYKSFNFDIRTYIVKRKMLLITPNLIKNDYSYINNLWIRVLNPEYESAILLARNFSDYRVFSDKHLNILDKNFSNDTLIILSKIWYKFKTSEDYKIVFKSLKRKLYIKNYLLGIYFWVLQQIFKLINKKNHLIVFYWPDLTWKTTLTNFFNDFCNQKIKNNYNLKHFFARPNLRKIVKTKSMVKIKDKKFLWTIKNYISFFERLFYYLIFIKLNLLKWQNFILDRFFLDFASKIKRYQKKYSYFLEKIIFIISPKPDLVFFLKWTPEIINSRKNELTVYQIKQAYNFYDYLFSKYPNHIPNIININIDNSLEKVQNDIVKWYLKKIKN